MYSSFLIFILHYLINFHLIMQVIKLSFRHSKPEHSPLQSCRLKISSDRCDVDVVQSLIYSVTVASYEIGLRYT